LGEVDPSLLPDLHTLEKLHSPIIIIGLVFWAFLSGFLLQINKINNKINNLNWKKFTHH